MRLTRPVQYWEVTATGLAPGYPRRVTSDWPGLPSDIEAAFTLQETGFSYIFKVHCHSSFHPKMPFSGQPVLEV